MDRAEQERDLEREAQRAEWRQRAAEDWSASLTEKLRLTDSQKAKLVQISNDYWTHLRDLRQTDAGAPPTREQRREQLSALRKSAESELAKILDPAQLTSYQELDEGSRLGRRGQRGQRGGRAGD
jgi:hypothetical protein